LFWSACSVITVSPLASGLTNINSAFLGLLDDSLYLAAASRHYLRHWAVVLVEMDDHRLSVRTVHFGPQDLA
jgi:hypothetical protein